MGRPKGVKNKPKTNQMITLKLTKQEFGLLTDWSKRHFWDNTQSFQDDIGEKYGLPIIFTKRSKTLCVFR